MSTDIMRRIFIGCKDDSHFERSPKNFWHASAADVVAVDVAKIMFRKSSVRDARRCLIPRHRSRQDRSDHGRSRATTVRAATFIVRRNQYMRQLPGQLGFADYWGCKHPVSPRACSIAVLGVGNSLLTDDGAGIHTLERFAASNTRDDVFCLDGGTVGLALLDRLSGLSGLIALDAMRLGKRPGTVTVLEGDAMDAHLRNQHGSVHEIGLSDLMDAMRLRGDLPSLRALIGIEPADIGWGTQPTPAVTAALPEAASSVRKLLHKWRMAAAGEAAA